MSRILIAAVITAVVPVLLSGCTHTQTSTHSGLIKVQVDPHGIDGGPYRQLRKNRVEKLLPVLTSIMTEAGLADVTESNVPFNITRFGNTTEQRCLKFKGQSAETVNTIPIQAVITFDTKEYETIGVELVEGYSSEPSERLSKLYGRLDQAFDQIEGEKYLSKIP